MFSKKSIVITIGDHGCVVALQEGDNIKKRIFVDRLDDSTKVELNKNIFSSDKKSPVYLLIDTSDQSYRKKIYPSIRTMDLSKIIKRDLANDGDDKSFKNYRILKQKKSKEKNKQNASRQECLFISISTSKVIESWVDYISALPNYLVGIYTLPIEGFHIFKALSKNIKEQSKIKNRRNDVYFLIVENKTSGVRQMVFSESQGLIFTRVVRYDLNDRDLVKKYEKDILSTIEYLKRLFVDISSRDIDIVNILPFELLEKIKNVSHDELHFVNYTPCQAALEANYSNTIPKNGKNCDLLFSKSFHKNRKILKFSIPKVQHLEKFFILLNVTKYVNVAAMIFIFISLLFFGVTLKKLDEKTEVAEMRMHNASKELSQLRSLGLGKHDEDVDIEQIFDFGRTETLLGKANADLLDFYIKLKFLKEFGVKLDEFEYNNRNYIDGNVNNIDYSFVFKGELANKSGDIDNLFIEFDALTGEIKKRFKDNKVIHSELPRNIDFNQKYYSYPINFELKFNK